MPVPRQKRLAAAVLAALVALAIVGRAAADSAATAVTPPAGPAGLTARAYILVDEATGTVLAQRSPDRELPMASTTKMMTALVTIEHASLDDVAVVPAEAVAVGGSTARLRTGERMTIRDLLTGLLVPSGNDAAVTLADHVGGSQTRFVAMMNARAAELGLTRTRFVTPHGLDRPGHHSTPRDLVTLGRELMTHPEIREIVRRRAAVIGTGGGARLVETENDLLRADPDVDGVKTGHTDGAGYALVAHARRASLGAGLYAALIGSASEGARVTDGKRLLDWGFAQFARPTLLRAGEVLARTQVRDRPGVTVALQARRSLSAPIRLGEEITESIVARPEVIAPVKRGQVVGKVTVRAGGRILGTVPLVASADVAAPGIADRLKAALDQVTP